MEVSRVRPALRVLHRRYGTWAAVAELLGWQQVRVEGVMFQHHQRRVAPELAHRVAEVLAAHLRPADPWRFLDDAPRRFPTAEERDRAGREHQRAIRARYRANANADSGER